MEVIAYIEQSVTYNSYDNNYTCTCTCILHVHASSYRQYLFYCVRYLHVELPLYSDFLYPTQD